METIHENAPTLGNAPVQAPRPLLGLSLRGDLGIHVLVGKVRLPEPNNTIDPGAAQYESLWAFVPMNNGTLNYEAFNAAVRTSANALISQQPDKDAVTLFHPIGKYISYHVTPYRGNVRPGEFLPPLTSLMTNPSRRNDKTRPVWVEFYMHSTPQPPTASAPDSLTSEVNQNLRRLDSKLGNGPDGRNTLHLGEVRGWTPTATRQLSVSRRDCACAAELSLLLLHLNSPGEPLRTIITRFGAAGERAAARANYEELLSRLARDLYFQWVGDAAVAAVLRGIERGDITRYSVQPGFLVLLHNYRLELAVEVEFLETAWRLQELSWGD